VIDVVRDQEGVRMALEEIFEEDFVRSRVDQESEGANEETRERMARQIPARTLSPGYYEFALHLLRLETEAKAGIPIAAAEVANFEAAGLVALERARGGFDRRHPPCSACGAAQQNRFTPQCHACGTKFHRKAV
jgi:hypothetical protein